MKEFSKSPQTNSSDHRSNTTELAITSCRPLTSGPPEIAVFPSRSVTHRAPMSHATPHRYGRAVERRYRHPRRTGLPPPPPPHNNIVCTGPRPRDSQERETGHWTQHRLVTIDSRYIDTVNTVPDLS
ncbi:hypothetical protein J6590_073027 [Homalodisca vitripennis]|nr:hypothetical protein J6590_073027 [Homalodisca vitripennis]